MKCEKLKKVGLSIVFMILIIFIESVIVHPISIYHMFSYTNKLYSNWEMDNSEVVNNITEKCIAFKGELQVECVVKSMSHNYNYNFTRAGSIEIPIIKKTDDFDTGYVCRDISISYDAIFRNLGYSTDYIFTSHHVYNHIWKDGVTCEINMIDYYCW